METLLKKRLFEAAKLAFEQTAFMIASPTLEERQLVAPIEHAVALEITSGHTGRMVLGVTAPILAGLAGNMVGDDMPLPQDEQRDALGEVANIICGAVLPALGEKGTVFRLTAPETVDFLDELGRPEAVEASHIVLGVEDGRAEILFWLDGLSG